MNELLAALLLEDRLTMVVNASGRQALRWTPPTSDPEEWRVLITIPGFRRQLPRAECEGRWTPVSDEPPSLTELIAVFPREELEWAAVEMARELKLAEERAGLKAAEKAALRVISLERQDDGKLWARVAFDPSGRTQRFMSDTGAWWKPTEGVWAFSERSSEGAIVEIRRWAMGEGRETSYVQR